MKPEVRAAKHLGQHFLSDTSVIDRILAFVAPKKGELFFEIGPGLGALTLPLLAKIQTMHAIEFDQRVLPFLRDKAKNLGNLELISGDFLAYHLPEISSSKRWRLLGNLPYNLSSPILLHVLAQREMIEDAHFMLQKEVVERIVAEVDSKAYGRLTLILQQFFDCEALFTIAPNAFIPPPKVDSAVVVLKTREMPRWQVEDMACFQMVVKEAFSKRRKMLRQSLKNLVSVEVLRDLGIDATARAENLGGDDYARIANFLSAC